MEGIIRFLSRSKKLEVCDLSHFVTILEKSAFNDPVIIYWIKTLVHSTWLIFYSDPRMSSGWVQDPQLIL